MEVGARSWGANYISTLKPPKTGEEDRREAKIKTYQFKLFQAILIIGSDDPSIRKSQNHSWWGDDLTHRSALLSLMTFCVCVCVCVSLFFYVLICQLFPGSTHLFIDCAIFPRNVWHDVGHSLSWYKIWYFLWNNLSLSPCYQAQSYVYNWSM